ncbi:MAG: hypothetical protein VYB54_03290 [Pseudomonadota bacterium]|nr:hypothetical protein [Pseudomonadota bacterium]
MKTAPAQASVELPPDFGQTWTGPVADAEELLNPPPDRCLEGLPPETLVAMQRAGEELLDIYRVLAKTGDNIVGLLLRDVETFYEWDHYPAGDAYDHETHAQYYYHAHRGATGEHGHFHTFLRAGGMPDSARPLPLERDEAWPAGGEALAHLVAISMSSTGVPTHLFTTNRWVTGETLYAAPDVIAMLDRFAMDLVWPSWPVNRWMTALMVLFRPQIAMLLHRRDTVLLDRIRRDPARDVPEDRNLEITALMAIDVDRQIAAVRRAIERA